MFLDLVVGLKYFVTLLPLDMEDLVMQMFDLFWCRQIKFNEYLACLLVSSFVSVALVSFSGNFLFSKGLGFVCLLGLIA